MQNYWSFPFPIGTLWILEENGSIAKLLLGKVCPFTQAQKKQTPLLKKAEQQLKEYFVGERKYFDLPLSLYGTPFQRDVWHALCQIPYGETRSYQQIAREVGNPKAYRAVGMANNRNPVMILVPCHRVIGKDGSLTGYRAGLSVKHYLLKLEQKYR